MKLIPLTLVAMAFAAPVAASSDAEFCREYAELTYMGTEDGEIMAPIIDGADEAILRVNAQGHPILERVALGAYLAGYASGLMLVEPADAAFEFFTGCMEEPV